MLTFVGVIHGAERIQSMYCIRRSFYSVTEEFAMSDALEEIMIEVESFT